MNKPNVSSDVHPNWRISNLNKKRVGRPSGFWVGEAMKMTRDELEGIEYAREDTHQRAYIFSKAIAHNF